MNLVPKKTTLFILIICTLYACNKEAFVDQPIYEQNEMFFLRNNSIQNNQNKASSLEIIKGPDLIDTIIKELKKLDLEKRFANTVVKKYGLPKWENALKVSNSNTYSSVFIPIADSNGKVNEILFAYQDNKNELNYKFINKNTYQNKLPEHGNPENTTFTRKSLIGIFNTLEEKVQNDLLILNNKQKTSFSIKANSIEIFEFCWHYTWSWHEIDGKVGVGTSTNQQCFYKIIITTPIAGDIIKDNSVPPPSSGNPSDYTNPIKDPCAQAAKNVAEANTLSQDKNFIDAVKEIQTASADDGNEHSISFGRTRDNEIIKSEIKTDGKSGQTSVYTGLENYYADIHNHPNNAKPSTRDLYGLVRTRQNYENYNTRFVLMANGEIFALTITDYSKASNFIAKYPETKDANGFYDFPANLRDEMYNIRDALVLQDFEDLDANCFALADILNKYDAGIALLKYENNTFKRQSIFGTLDESTNKKNYTKNNCN
ncbi:MAG: hypothetical protein RLZZ546_1145 [Bacteroidota bacterium]|jgi:hypothetical protein